MSLYTKTQGYPYPSAVQPGNGAVDIQALARAFAPDLDELDAQWPGQLTKPLFKAGLSGSATGFLSTFELPVNFTLTVTNVGAFVNNGTRILVPEAGWYAGSMNLSATPSGGATANSLRQVRVAVLDYSAPYADSDSMIEEFLCRDFESGGETNLQVDFVTYLTPEHQLAVYFYNENAASSMTLTSATTFFTLALIVPEG